jgi:hypothetical protein
MYSSAFQGWQSELRLGHPQSPPPGRRPEDRVLQETRKRETTKKAMVMVNHLTIAMLTELQSPTWEPHKILRKNIMFQRRNQVVFFKYGRVEQKTHLHIV